MSKDDMAIKTHLVDLNTIQQELENNKSLAPGGPRNRRNTLTEIKTHQPANQQRAILLQSGSIFNVNNEDEGITDLNDRTQNQFSSINGNN